MKSWKIALAALAAMGAQPLAAQMQAVPDRAIDEGEGPFGTLLIRGATVIEGTGAPPAGPIDIIVEGNRIAALYPGGAPAEQAQSAQRVIEAQGMYVLPGFVDTHGHNGDPGKAAQPSYGYKLWLAHGVTTVRGVSFYFGSGTPDISDAERSAANTITAPRLIPYAVFGHKWSRGAPDTPAKAREWVRWAKAQGFWGIKFFNSATPQVLAAALDEAELQQMGTVAHLAQTGVAEVNARTAVESGLDGVTHFYGHFESLLKDSALPYYPEDYNYFDEQSRFGWVARLAPQAVEPGSDKWEDYVDLLVDSDVTLSPTFNIYSASRDVMAAKTRDWHAKYTLPSLMDFYAPSATNHGSYYKDWSSEDEVAWRNFYAKWFDLTKDFHDRGGRVTAGSDPGYIYQTWGFAYIGELEMLREAGLSPLAVIRAATIDGAREIYEPRGVEPPMGRIAVGQLADLVIVPENPLANLKVLYGTGHTRLNYETGAIEQVGGVRWTIKDGIVYDAPALLADVARMVEEQRAGR
ncbi:amidohydrolase family protein [Erythrobacter sp.]|uniref:amidohydrolase family protein n=1 Tax=Erythrobacter sp. TaxID=1042 RepID=UPI001B0965BC|nr:amidohydrolase family protein [Erythrobacter sp.]MBO6527139.1 amidohydrolase family protein [Erythrobacter sp.]MBO6529019.1 amidohydrolase family protein [Erythrobacter sp.]